MKDKQHNMFTVRESARKMYKAYSLPARDFSSSDKETGIQRSPNLADGEHPPRVFCEGYVLQRDQVGITSNLQC